MNTEYKYEHNEFLNWQWQKTTGDQNLTMIIEDFTLDSSFFKVSEGVEPVNKAFTKIIF